MSIRVISTNFKIATQSSSEGNSLINKYEEGREYNREDYREDTVLSNAKNTEEEASLKHVGKSSSLDSSERPENNDENDYGTGAKEKNSTATATAEVTGIPVPEETLQNVWGY